jgi:hypothetical protein
VNAITFRHHVEPASDPAKRRQHLGLRWWREALYVAVFYLVYSAIRNQFGSVSVSPEEALENARTVIDLQESLGLFIEEDIQDFFVGRDAEGNIDFRFPGAGLFLTFWNIFYGTLHFILTAGALVWLFRRFPDDYAHWRNTLAATTALALIGFSLYPLMPPRLLPDCGEFGACLSQFGFVDTLAEVGGLWSFDSETMEAVSNQYAAMPSLHFAWSVWTFLVLYPRLAQRWARIAIACYPPATLWAIVVTANHFWLDAVGGALTLVVGWLVGSRLARWSRARRDARHPAEQVP